MTTSSPTHQSLPKAASLGSLEVGDDHIWTDPQVWTGPSFKTTTIAGAAICEPSLDFQPPTERPAESQEYVLVVDDNPEGRELIKLVLHRERIAVEVAVDGEEVLKRNLGGAKLILLDLNLPKLDGEATARILRGRGFTGPIVAYTGVESSKARLARSGFTGYLSKDTPMGRLIAICRRYFPADFSTTMQNVSTNRPNVPAGERFISSRRRELQRSYVEGLYESIDALRQAVDTGNFRQVQAIAHRLAGTGGLYDLPIVSDCGRRLYDAVDSGELPPQLNAMIDQLEIQADRAGSLMRRTIEPR